MQLERTHNDFEAGLKRLADPASQSAMQSDAELLELYLYGGRQEAMVALVQRFAPLVTSVIRRVVSHPQDAEDAFQATFLILLKSAQNIRSRPSIAAWLYGVAYRTACRVRAKSRRQAQSLGEADMPACGAEHNPIVELARQIELGNLDRELGNLPDHLREPLTEHYIFGYSARQIADRMDLSVSAVEGRLRRGRRLLRHRLALRGASLSVVVTGAAWFRDHASTASASEAWTEHLLQSPMFAPQAATSALSSCDSYLAELVQGESTMYVAPFLKSAGFLGAAAFAVVSMSVIAVAMQFGAAPKLASGAPTAGQVQRTEANSQEPAEATIDAFAAQSGGVDPFGQAAPDEPPAPVTTRANPTHPTGNAATAAAGAATSGPMGTGNAATFVRPSGEAPNWLRAGEEDMSKSEMMRDKLRQTVDVKFVGLPLRETLETILTGNGLPYVLNETELEKLSVDPETPITLSLGELTLSDALEVILKPLNLQYEVKPQYVKISSADESNGAVRYYDLAYVLPTSAGVRDLVRTIEATSSANEAWQSQGGMSSISLVGSMMVVNCSEQTHRQIEKLLAELAKVNPENLRSSHFSTQPPVGMGGMGGGGMGGGGMGGMGGGGMF